MHVLFIGGQVRSGSTLLERLLGELPGVCSLGEVTQLWARVGRDDVRCGCGSWFAACDFWAEVGNRAFGGWVHAGLDRVLALQRRVGQLRSAVRTISPWLPGDLPAQLTEYADYYARVYAAAAASTGARVVVDSSKNPGLAFCLREVRDLDVRVAHLVRDPRGVAYSLTKHVPNPDQDGAMQPRHSPLVSALQWTGVNTALELLAMPHRSGGRTRRRLPIHRIRYEDLLGDPAGTLRALARFAGLDVAGDGLSYLRGEDAELGVIHSAGGNRMRFDRGKVPLRRDDAWRIGLPARHRALVGTLCLPLIAAYGYSSLTRSPGGRRAGESQPASSTHA